MITLLVGSTIAVSGLWIVWQIPPVAVLSNFTPNA
jgi:hypothetical protein